jgi:malate synthase
MQVRAQVRAPLEDRYDEVLTDGALALVGRLHEELDARRRELLDARQELQARLDAGESLDFVTAPSDFRVAPVPAALQDRRVEITGPTSRKMAINALNSGARVWLADLEDANTPHWRNVVEGQVNLADAVRRTIAFTSPEGKGYQLDDPDHLPVILPRPRGWHLDEAHLTLDGRPLVGGLVDFGLYFFHNAAEQLSRGSGPYFYLPKMESHLEARLWNDVFCHAQHELGIPQGSVRATVLIETITAAFEMEEILWELRDHVSGLNAGRWDYLFSIIKNFREADGFTLPDRSAITMKAPMMQAYADLLVQTCHKRGAFAMGGMAAFIPSRKDAAVNEAAFAKVREDKEREARAGFDGSWVAHPDLVPVCAEIFDGVLDGDNQVARQRDDVHVSAADLLAAAATPGERTMDGLRLNINVGIAYVAAWLAGNGAAAIHNLMEDAATAEISRSQIWQWTHSSTTLATGETVTRELVESVVTDELAALREAGWYADHLDAARDIFVATALDDEFVDFLTLPAYAEVVRAGE